MFNIQARKPDEGDMIIVQQTASEDKSEKKIRDDMLL